MGNPLLNAVQEIEKHEQYEYVGFKSELYLSARSTLLVNPNEQSLGAYADMFRTERNDREKVRGYISKVLSNMQNQSSRRSRRGPREKSRESGPTVDIVPIRPEALNTESDIMGAEREKREFFTLFTLPLTYGDYFTESNLMLLYGPPGTGKTMFANSTSDTMRNLLRGVDVNYFSLPSGAYKGGLLGQTEQNLSEMFRVADNYAKYGAKERGAAVPGGRQAGKSIVFMDEFESLAKSRDKDSGVGTQTTVPHLLQILGNRHEMKDIVFIAATNYPWILDSAVLRRFDARLFVDLPTRATRKMIAQSIVQKRFGINLQEGSSCDGDLSNTAMCDAGIENIVQKTGFSMQFMANTERLFERISRNIGISLGLLMEWFNSRRDDISGTSLGVGYSNSDMNKIVNRAINMYASDVISYKVYEIMDDRSNFESTSPDDDDKVIAAKRMNNTRLAILSMRGRERIVIERPLPFKYLRDKENITYKMFFLSDLTAYFDQALEDYPPTVNTEEYVNLLVYYLSNKSPSDWRE